MSVPALDTAPRARPAARPRRPRDSRELLIRHAARLFRERGYTATSVRDIVKRAGIEPSALYYHFASKEALLDEVLDRSMSLLMHDVRAAVEALPPQTSLRERIRTAIAAHVRSHLGHGDFGLASRHVMAQTPPSMRRKHELLRSAYGAYWHALLEEAAQGGALRAAGHLGLARMFLIGALNWTSEWFDLRKATPEILADVFCAILFDGISAQSIDTLPSSSTGLLT